MAIALPAQASATTLRVATWTDEGRVLTDRTGLGCRNPIGLDHILASDELAKAFLSATKVPLGTRPC